MRIIKCLLPLMVALVSFKLLAVESANVEMHVGSLKMLPIKNIIRVAIGKGDVVSSKIIEGKGLLLIAENPGDTELRVWRKGERESRIIVTVKAEDPVKLLSSVNELLRNYPDVKSREVNGVVLMEGFADKDEIEQLNKLNSMIPNLIVLVKPKKIQFEKMVKMELKIVEFSKKQLKNLGIKWDSVLAGPAAGYAGSLSANQLFGVVSPSSNGTSNLIAQAINDAGGPGLLEDASFGHFGLVSGITSQINLLMETGDAKLLAEPMLNTRSGDTAEFLAGGEFPVPVPQENGVTTIEFREYGIRLDIEPIADDDGNIQSTIRTEVSTLDFSVSVLGVPGLLTRRTDSVVNVKDGETIVISGLVNSDISKAISKVPLLGDIPIIGELFKSTDFQTKKTELVIFVTPKIVDVNTEEHKKYLQRAKEMIENFNQMESLQVLD